MNGYEKQVKFILKAHGWELLRHGKGHTNIGVRTATKQLLLIIIASQDTLPTPL